MNFLKMIFTKLNRNKFLYLSLIIGLILSVAAISSIPVYSEGIITRIIRKQINDQQKKDNSYQGIETITYNFNEGKISAQEKLVQKEKRDYFDDEKISDYYKASKDSFIKQEQFIEAEGEEACYLPMLQKNTIYLTDNYSMSLDKDKASEKDKVKYRHMRLGSLKIINDAIKVVDGRLPSKEVKDGVYEGIISENERAERNLVIGNTYVLSDIRQGGYEDVKVKIVGVFEQNVEDIYFWSAYNMGTEFNDTILIDNDNFYNYMINVDHTRISTAKWFYAFDFNNITLNQLKIIRNRYGNLQEDVKDINNNTKFYNGIVKATLGYDDYEEQISTIMISINTSLMVMMIIYIIMILNLIMDRERNEVSLLISRGAKRSQIISIYMMEGLLMSIIALIIGPIIGLFISKFLGLFSSYMVFSERWKLSGGLNLKAYLYSLYVVIIFNIIMVFIAFIHSKDTIVEQKKKKSRSKDKAFYHKYYIDIVVFAFAIYESSTFNKQLKDAGIVLSSESLSVNPMMFLIPALFTISLFMILLRIQPYLIKLIFFIRKKRWSGEVYVTFLNLSRTSERYHFIMIFLALTISIGLYSGTIARSMNSYIEDKIRCEDGADLVIKLDWESEKNSSSIMGGGSNYVGPKRYSEPNTDVIKKLNGIENISKVLNTNISIASTNGEYLTDECTMIAMEPYEFGQVAWSTEKLLPYDLNHYLNLLTEYPTGCFISSYAASDMRLKNGDKIDVYYDSYSKCTLTVMGIVDVWPGYVPSQQNRNGLVIANLRHINDNLNMIPYELWAKQKEGFDSDKINEEIKKNDINATISKKLDDDIYKVSTEPLRLTINSAMTLGFIICIIICIAGFMIFWIIFVRSKTLQFGIFRSMGITTKDIFKSLIVEQLFTSGYAIIGGISIGIITSIMFTPYIEIAMYGGKSYFPFRVIIDLLDVIKLVIIIICMMIIVMLLLGWFVSKLKIDKAVKLGEE